MDMHLFGGVQNRRPLFDRYRLFVNRDIYHVFQRTACARLAENCSPPNGTCAGRSGQSLLFDDRFELTG